MQHHAKHHASENRRTIERSLETRTKNVLSLGRLWSRLDTTTTDRLRRSYFAYIAITKPRVLASKDTCMVFRIIWHLRCLSPTFVSVSPMNFPPRRNSRVIYIKRKSIAGSEKGEQCFGIFCRHGGDLCQGIRRGGRRR